jgi:predicted acyltransferase
MSAAREPALDVFRGATVALMILVNNPGSWSALYPPLAHAPWHGVTPTDLVFPFFLFAVGHALALVMPALLAGPPRVFWARVARRTALIFAIGLLLNAAPFVRWDAAGELVLRDWSQLRIMGVLQRIALCFGAAAAIVWWAERHTARPQRAVLAVVAVLLLGYQAMCVTLGAPGDPYSLQGWFGTAWDKALLGESHLYRGEGMPFDPEGLASTPPAVAQVLLGWWVGRTLACGAIDARAVARLFAAAVVLGVLAYAWQLGMPLNKKIWTSSYVLLTTSLAMATLAALIHLLNHGTRLDGRPARATGGLGGAVHVVRPQSAGPLRAGGPGAALPGADPLASRHRRRWQPALDEPAALGARARGGADRIARQHRSTPGLTAVRAAQPGVLRRAGRLAAPLQAVLARLKAAPAGRHWSGRSRAFHNRAQSQEIRHECPAA